MGRNLCGQAGSGEDFMSCVSPDLMGWVWSQAGISDWNMVVVHAGCQMVHKCFEIKGTFYMLIRFSRSQPLGTAHSRGCVVHRHSHPLESSEAVCNIADLTLRCTAAVSHPPKTP